MLSSPPPRYPPLKPSSASAAAAAPPSSSSSSLYSSTTMESPSPPRHSLSSSSSSSPSPPSAEVLSTCIHQLNEEFPTIASLSSLDSRMSSLQTRLRALDKDILVAVREQARRSSSSSSSSSTSLQSFRQCVKDLVAGLNSMKERADSSDRRVTKICDDIKRLALAKDNLTLSISTLKRLVMLMTALDRLRQAAASRRYAEASQLLLAVNNLVEVFEPYRGRGKPGGRRGKAEHLDRNKSQKREEDLERTTRIRGNHYEGTLKEEEERDDEARGDISHVGGRRRGEEEEEGGEKKKVEEEEDEEEEIPQIRHLLEEKETLCRALQQQLIEDYQAVFDEEIPLSSSFLSLHHTRGGGRRGYLREGHSSSSSLRTKKGGGEEDGDAGTLHAPHTTNPFHEAATESSTETSLVKSMMKGILGGVGEKKVGEGEDEEDERKRRKEKDRHLSYQDEEGEDEEEERDFLQEAYLAVEALGPETVRDTVQLVAHSLLYNYNKLFQPSHASSLYLPSLNNGAPISSSSLGEGGGLEVVDRRFAWLKRTMREYEGKYEKFFPSYWRVKSQLAVLFCRVTKQHLMDLLSVSQHTVDPVFLVRLLHKTVEFELSLDAKFRQEERSIQMFSAIDERSHAFSQLSPPPVLTSIQYYDSIFGLNQEKQRALPEIPPSSSSTSGAKSFNPFSSDVEERKNPFDERGGENRGETSHSCTSRSGGVVGTTEERKTKKGVDLERERDNSSSSSSHLSSHREQHTSLLPPRIFSSSPSSHFFLSQKPVLFRGMLSSAFDPFLFRWTQHEESQLYEVFSQALLPSTDRILIHGRHLDTLRRILLLASRRKSDDERDDEEEREEDEEDHMQTQKRRRSRGGEEEETSEGRDQEEEEEDEEEEEEEEEEDEESDICMYTSASEVLSACKKVFDKAKSVTRVQVVKEVSLVFLRLFLKYAEALHQNRLPSSKQFTHPPSSSDVSILLHSSSPSSSTPDPSPFSSSSASSSSFAPISSSSSSSMLLPSCSTSLSCLASSSSSFLSACACIGTSVYVERSLQKLESSISKALREGDYGIGELEEEEGLDGSHYQQGGARLGGQGGSFPDGMSLYGGRSSSSRTELNHIKLDEARDKLWEVQSRGIALLVGSFERMIASSLSHLYEAAPLSQTRGEGREGRLRHDAHYEEASHKSTARRGPAAVYVQRLRRGLIEGMCFVSFFLNHALFRFVCDKLTQAVVRRVHVVLETVLTKKKTSTSHPQSSSSSSPSLLTLLLRDLEDLRCLLLHLPSASAYWVNEEVQEPQPHDRHRRGKESKSSVKGGGGHDGDLGGGERRRRKGRRQLRMPAGYAKFINREFDHLEAMVREHAGGGALAISSSSQGGRGTGEREGHGGWSSSNSTTSSSSSGALLPSSLSSVSSSFFGSSKKTPHASQKSIMQTSSLLSSSSLPGGVSVASSTDTRSGPSKTPFTSTRGAPSTTTTSTSSSLLFSSSSTSTTSITTASTSRGGTGGASARPRDSITSAMIT